MRFRLWVSLCSILGLAGVALFASSCGGSSHAQIRLVNAIVLQQSGLTMLIDGNSVASNVGYGTASSYASVSSGSRHVQIEPTGTSTPIIDTTQTLGSGSATTALAYLDVSNNVAGAFLADNNAAPSSGNFNIRIINACPAIGSAGADVYVVPTGTNISGVNPNFTSVLDNGSATAYLSLPAGTYDIIFTPPNQKSVIAESTQIVFSAGQVRTSIVLNGVSGGTSVAVLPDAG